MKTTYTLSETDVKKAVANYIETSTGKSVSWEDLTVRQEDSVGTVTSLVAEEKEEKDYNWR